MAVPTDLEVRTFADAAELDAWLDAEGARSPGVHLRLAKKGASLTTVRYDEAVEVALCHGWIDGQANRFDEQSYLVRLTPRRPRSVWSQKNVDTVARLTAAGRMRPAGLAQVEAAQADGRWDRAYSAAMPVPDDLAAALDAEPAARAAFDALGRTARYTVLFGVHTAASDRTRAARITAAVRKLAGDDG